MKILLQKVDKIEMMLSSKADAKVCLQLSVHACVHHNTLNMFFLLVRLFIPLIFLIIIELFASGLC